MSYTRTDRIQYDDIYNDSFSRLRTSFSNILFQSSFKYGVEPNEFVATTVGGGSATHTDWASFWNLSVATVSGDKITFQSFIPFRYIFGNTIRAYYVMTIGDPVIGTVTRIGQFSDLHGFFFKQTESGLFVSNRLQFFTITAEVDVAQADWNVDKLNGTGPSGKTLTATAVNIFVVEYGMGVVRFGVKFGDHIIYVHYIEDPQATQFLTNGDLSTRFEVENVATSLGKTISVFDVCVEQEGGYIGMTPGVPRTVLRSETGTFPISTGSWTPIGGLRMKTTLNSVPVTGSGVLADLKFLIQSGDSIIYRIKRNPTTITGASWTSVAADSQFEFDISATSTTGGFVMFHGFFEDSGDTATSVPFSVEGAGMANTILFAPGLTYMIEGRGIGGTSNMWAAFNFIENYS